MLHNEEGLDAKGPSRNNKEGKEVLCLFVFALSVNVVADCQEITLK